jgi:hypothetical protein
VACMRISQAVENMLYPFLLVWEPWTLIFPWLALVLLSALWILCLDNFLFPANMVKIMYKLGAICGFYIFLWVTFTACILFVCTLLPSWQAVVSGENLRTKLSDLIFSQVWVDTPGVQIMVHRLGRSLGIFCQVRCFPVW